MTTPTPRWTAETAELARATAFDAMACAPWPPPDEQTVLELIEAGELPETYDRETAEHYAEMYVAEQVLAVLADAGVLIPVGGETRQEWRVWVTYHGPLDRLDGIAVTAETARQHIEKRRALGYPEPGTVQTRTVAETAWREVTDGG